jgi:hypothetical protein
VAPCRPFCTNRSRYRCCRGIDRRGDQAVRFPKQSRVEGSRSHRRRRFRGPIGSRCQERDGTRLDRRAASLLLLRAHSKNSFRRVRMRIRGDNRAKVHREASCDLRRQEFQRSRSVHRLALLRTVKGTRPVKRGAVWRPCNCLCLDWMDRSAVGPDRRIRLGNRSTAVPVQRGVCERNIDRGS